MTTIAYRDGILAADTRATFAGSVVGSVVKIASRAGGDLAGAAGNATYANAFISWFLKADGSEPPKAEVDDHHCDRGVIFKRNGDILVFEMGGKFSIKSDYFAFGSGIEYALGAMHHGATAAQAVAAAAAHDQNTGGNITILRNH